MTWTYSEEYYKNYTRDTWNESASRYDPIKRNLDKFNADLLKAATPKPGDHVLDVATGTGEPALSLGSIVGPKGRVLGVDLAAKMVEIARSQATKLGLSNVDFKVMDAENLTLKDETMDLAVSRFGLQIVTDPEKTMKEMYRVLKPGGRFAATVWGPGERVPAIHVIVGPMLEYAEPDETGYLPTPYEMGGPGELAKILKDTGFKDAHESRITHDWTVKDEAEYFEAVLKGTPIGHSLSEEEPKVQKAVMERTTANLQKWKTRSGIVLPAEAVVVAARK
ncbi:MAG: class I SAM-dependent methyltransferase [Euryarchaeota archaeon]|nr:class I SAM-dependent methyltransferase [Euryarchaeota archaeon]